MDFLVFIKKLLRSLFGRKKTKGNVSPKPLEKPPDKTVSPGKKEKRSVMELEVLRYSSQNKSTLGLLFEVKEGRRFLCYTLEDEYRAQKEYGKTRIPAGRYSITLRTEGGFHQRYSDKFKEMHKGMLWVREVPGFEFILIHIGNNTEDTAGCLLVGDSSIQNITEEGFIGNSTAAYVRVYPLVAEALERGDEVYITYVDYDMPQTT